MKILSVPLLIQPLPSPPLLPLSSEYIGLFLLHLVTMWELQKENSLLICGRRWDRVPKVFPLHLVRQQSVPRGSLQGFVCPSGGGMAGDAPLPDSSGGIPGSSKYWGRPSKQGKNRMGWSGAPWSGFREKRRSKTYWGRRKFEEKHPTLLLGTENAGKLIGKCGCVMARFSCPDPTTKCSSGNSAISQFAWQVPLMFPSLWT